MWWCHLAMLGKSLATGAEVNAAKTTPSDLEGWKLFREEMEEGMEEWKEEEKKKGKEEIIKGLRRGFLVLRVEEAERGMG